MARRYSRRGHCVGYCRECVRCCELGWDGLRLVRELIAVDYVTMENLTEEQEGHAAQWAPVFMNHPETWRLLVTGTERIVGYWYFVAHFESEFQRAVRGELLDSEITEDRVQVFELPGTYSIYFPSVAVLSMFRRPGVIKLLAQSFRGSLS